MEKVVEENAVYISNVSYQVTEDNLRDFVQYAYVLCHALALQGV